MSNTDDHTGEAVRRRTRNQLGMKRALGLAPWGDGLYRRSWAGVWFYLPLIIPVWAFAVIGALAGSATVIVFDALSSAVTR